MSVFDKAKDKAERMVGQVKERIGRNTGDRELEDAGKRDQMKGEAKEAAHDLRDRAAGALKDAKDRLRGEDHPGGTEKPRDTDRPPPG